MLSLKQIAHSFTFNKEDEKLFNTKHLHVHVNISITHVMDFYRIILGIHLDNLNPSLIGQLYVHIHKPLSEIYVPIYLHLKFAYYPYIDITESLDQVKFPLFVSNVRVYVHTCMADM